MKLEISQKIRTATSRKVWLVYAGSLFLYLIYFCIYLFLLCVLFYPFKNLYTASHFSSSLSINYQILTAFFFTSIRLCSFKLCLYLIEVFSTPSIFSVVYKSLTAFFSTCCVFMSLLSISFIHGIHTMFNNSKPNGILFYSVE